MAAPLHSFDGTQLLHLEHGYCNTVLAAQGQTCERILIDADSTSLTANESSHYVAISRARLEATIYTDDRDMLPVAVTCEDVKHAALDLTSDRFSDKAVKISKYSSCARHGEFQPANCTVRKVTSGTLQPGILS